MGLTSLIDDYGGFLSVYPTTVQQYNALLSVL